VSLSQVTMVLVCRSTAEIPN